MVVFFFGGFWYRSSQRALWLSSVCARSVPGGSFVPDEQSFSPWKAGAERLRREAFYGFNSFRRANRSTIGGFEAGSGRGGGASAYLVLLSLLQTVFQPLELLCEKSIGTANRPMGAGEALRRVLECLASGIVMPG